MKRAKKNSPQNHIRSKNKFYTSDRKQKVLSHSSLRRSCKWSLERQRMRQYKIKVVYLYESIYIAIGQRKRFWRAAVLNLIRTIILQTLLLKHSLFLLSEVTLSASKAISGLCSTASRGEPHQEGRTCIIQPTQLAARPRETESNLVFHTPSCCFLPCTLTFSARCSPSLQSKVILPSQLKAKPMVIKNCLLSCVQVTANHISVACKWFFCLKGKDIPELGALVAYSKVATGTLNCCKH